MSNNGDQVHTAAAQLLFVKTFKDLNYIVGPSGSCVKEVRQHFDAIEQTAEVTRKVQEVANPADLDDVDVGIVRAHFGVAETAAVWLTERALVMQALSFLAQHLVILLDPRDIVSDMHAAYEQCHLGEAAYGCFMVGPSATADIDGVLVYGAQGALSLMVLFLNQPSA